MSGVITATMPTMAETTGVHIDVGLIPAHVAQDLGDSTLGFIFRLLDDPDAERRLYERLAARGGTADALAWLDARREQKLKGGESE